MSKTIHFITTIFILFMFTYEQPSFAQLFFATHVQGKIYNVSTQQYLITGDQVSETDSLKFYNNHSWSVLAGYKGNVFLSHSIEKDSITICKNAIQAIVSSAIVNQKQGIIDNLENYFQGEQFVFIGHDFQLNLNPEVYPLSEKSFLIYRYEYNERHITIEIPYNKQRIYLDPKVLYTYKGEHIPPYKTKNTSIYVFNAVDNIPFMAATFQPIWLKDEDIKKELQVLKNIYTQQQKSNTENKEAYLHYINDVYGKTDEVYFYNWLETHGF